MIIKGENITQVIQVCYSLTEQNRKREVAGLLEAMDEFNLSEGTIITDDVGDVEMHGEKSVRYVAL